GDHRRAGRHRDRRAGPGRDARVLPPAGPARARRRPGRGARGGPARRGAADVRHRGGPAGVPPRLDAAPARGWPGGAGGAGARPRGRGRAARAGDRRRPPQRAGTVRRPLGPALRDGARSGRHRRRPLRAAVGL
ncbi:MAG: putative quinone binding protein, partial [uncultured Pseudonocardia sp.]